MPRAQPHHPLAWGIKQEGDGFGTSGQGEMGRGGVGGKGANPKSTFCVRNIDAQLSVTMFEHQESSRLRKLANEECDPRYVS